MNKYFPNAKLIVHYNPQVYELYKDNPKVLFENVPEYSIPPSKLCYDTAHETNLDNLI